MSSSQNAIKVLAQRFVSLPPLVRMTVTKKLLELYSSDEASRKIEQSGDSCCRAPGKSFIEQFWDEVEEAHGDHLHEVNPFTEEMRPQALKVRDASETVEREGYLPWSRQQSNLIALL